MNRPLLTCYHTDLTAVLIHLAGNEELRAYRSDHMECRALQDKLKNRKDHKMNEQISQWDLHSMISQGDEIAPVDCNFQDTDVSL